MLVVKKLDFDFPETLLLHQVEFMLDASQLLHLRGNNGAGKTTLLKLLAGILHPHSGDILFQGQSIYHDLSNYQQNICYIGHKSGISAYLTIRENCRFDLHYPSSTLSIDELLNIFELRDIEHIACGKLSAGQRRRVALLRLVMSNALVWLLDEPFVALDQKTLLILMDRMKQHLKRGGSIILTSHQDLPLTLKNSKEYCL